MNYLQAVFWDYPEFTNPDAIRQCLQESENPGMRRWLLLRFLEHGRVVDTFKFFPVEVIAEEFPALSLQPYTRKKWGRILDVYAPSTRK
jgi:hypothetical protein